MKQNENNIIILELIPCMRMFIIENWPMLIFYGVIVYLLSVDDMTVKLAAAGAVVLFSSMLLYRFIYLSRMKWIVTRLQIRSEHGVFTRDIQYLELYRVVDYSEKQSFLQMLTGIKDVIVYSGDRTTPALRIMGIPASMEVIPILKQLVEEQKKIHNIYEITNR